MKFTTSGLSHTKKRAEPEVNSLQTCAGKNRKAAKVIHTIPDQYTKPEEIVSGLSSPLILVTHGLYFLTKVAQSITFEDIIQSCFVPILTT